MKTGKILAVFGCVLYLWAVRTNGEEKTGKKLTCCQEAAAHDGKECKHKCCIAAHRSGKSCEKCNPNKEDLKLKKDAKGTGK
jgi:hypothetical protein